MNENRQRLEMKTIIYQSRAERALRTNENVRGSRRK